MIKYKILSAIKLFNFYIHYTLDIITIITVKLFIKYTA